MSNAPVILGSALLALLGASSYLAVNAYIADSWRHRGQLLRCALDERRWLDLDLPEQAVWLANTYLEGPKQSDPMDQTVRVSLFRGTLGVDDMSAQRAVRTGELLTARALDRLAAWTDDPDRSARDLIYGWGPQVARQYLWLAQFGLKYVARPLMRRVLERVKRATEISAITATFLGILSWPLVTVVVADASWFGYIGSWTVMGAVGGVVWPAVTEVASVLQRGRERDVPSATQSRWWTLGVAGVIFLVPPLIWWGMDWWFRKSAAITDTLFSTTYLGVGVGAALLLGCLAWLCARNLRLAQSHGRTWQARILAWARAAASIWVMVMFGLIWAQEDGSLDAPGVYEVWAWALLVPVVLVLTSEMLRYRSFRRHLTEVRLAGLPVAQGTYRQWIIRAAIAGFAGGILVDIADFGSSTISAGLSLAAAMAVLTSLPVVAQQALARRRWRARVEDAYSKLMKAQSGSAHWP